MKKKPNKQHDARAASFRRVAKDLRAEAKSFRRPGHNDFFPARAVEAVARSMDAEAKRLRAMR